jgi:hypothetical protein
LTTEPINEYVQSCDIVAFNKICKCRWLLCDNIMEPSRACVFESVLTHAYMLFILFIAESKDHGDNGRRRGF